MAWNMLPAIIFSKEIPKVTLKQLDRHMTQSGIKQLERVHFIFTPNGAISLFLIMC